MHGQVHGGQSPQKAAESSVKGDTNPTSPNGRTETFRSFEIKEDPDDQLKSETSCINLIAETSREQMLESPEQKSQKAFPNFDNVPQRNVEAIAIREDDENEEKASNSLKPLSRLDLHEGGSTSTVKF